MSDTNIDWADKVWNPIVGCTPAGAGCKNCYAKINHDKWNRILHAGTAKRPVPEQYRLPFEVVQFLPERLAQPAKWRAPRTIFVNSVSDLFHPKVKRLWQEEILFSMSGSPRHTYVILTKRPGRMAKEMLMWQAALWPKVYLGASICTQADADVAVPELQKLQAAGWNTLVSCEPLLESVSLRGFHPSWLIIGAESGPKRRPCQELWVGNVIAGACKSECLFFVKQLDLPGGLCGKCVTDPAKFPEYLRLRETPVPLRPKRARRKAVKR